MELTAAQQKYFAYWLTRSLPSDSLSKLTASLQDAQVDLTPHQIDAALFAFKSPLSKGAILADEVGLGKTIEIGIIRSQFWAEHRRYLLIIASANLRKQWAAEFQEKFFLPLRILGAKTFFNRHIEDGNLNPFNCEEIVICSYQFAKTKVPYLKQTNWDMVVIDEAHRPRNVYKPFTYSAEAELYWKHGNSSEHDFIFTTPQLITAEMLETIHDQLGEDESMLICFTKFQPECRTKFPNITIKKIPKVHLDTCEFDLDDYSLNIVSVLDIDNEEWEELDTEECNS